jgi:hypothetical protein
MVVLVHPASTGATVGHAAPDPHVAGEVGTGPQAWVVWLKQTIPSAQSLSLAHGAGTHSETVVGAHAGFLQTSPGAQAIAGHALTSLYWHWYPFTQSEFWAQEVWARAVLVAKEMTVAPARAARAARRRRDREAKSEEAVMVSLSPAARSVRANGGLLQHRPCHAIALIFNAFDRAIVCRGSFDSGRSIRPSERAASRTPALRVRNSDVAASLTLRAVAPRVGRVIHGAHVIIYSKSAEADRDFFRDVLRYPFADAGHGWLIFALPPAEIAVHPSDENDVHEFYLMCDDVHAFVSEMHAKRVACSPIEEQRWGSITRLTLPGGGALGVYQPRHPSPRQTRPRQVAESASRAKMHSKGASPKKPLAKAATSAKRSAQSALPKKAAAKGASPAKGRARNASRSKRRG